MPTVELGEERLLAATRAFSALLPGKKKTHPSPTSNCAHRLLQVMLINPVCVSAFKPGIEYPNVCLPIRQYILCKLARVSLLRTVFPRTGAAGEGPEPMVVIPLHESIIHSLLHTHCLGAYSAWPPMAILVPAASWGLLEEGHTGPRGGDHRHPGP